MGVIMTLTAKNPVDPLTSEFYLWHLVQLGLLAPLEPKAQFAKPTLIGAELWKKAKGAPAITVAMIDTGIDTGHPNLKAAAKDFRQVDFGPSLWGVTYSPPATIAETEKAAVEPQPGIVPPLALTEADKLLDAIIPKDGVDAELRSQCRSVLCSKAAAATQGPSPASAPFANLTLQDPSTLFGAHGTGCAGLIAGNSPEYDKDSTGSDTALPYLGVNPYARILPISTPYSHEILPVVMGLLYALRAGAQVIYMPRGVPDILARTKAVEGSPHRTRIDDPGDPTRVAPADHASNAKLKAHQKLFENLLAHLCASRLVVVAAGNSGRGTQLSYPASLRQSDKVRFENLLVIGARNFLGHVSSYSDGRDLPDMVWMPSDDGFAYDARDQRFDGGSYSGDEIRDPAKATAYSPYGLFSLDPRGSYGHDSGQNEDPAENAAAGTGGLYTLFGGTSGASALAAGLISLLVQAGTLAANAQHADVAKALSGHYRPSPSA